MMKNPLSPLEIGKRLGAMEQHNQLSKNDQRLLQLFADRAEVPLMEAATTLYPKGDDKAALASFKVYRGRFNEKAASFELELYADSSRKPASGKKLCFYSTNQDEAEIENTVEQMARQAEQVLGDMERSAYPPSRYISAEVVVDPKLVNRQGSKYEEWIKAARFPKSVSRLMEHLFPQAWYALSEDDRDILRYLAVRFEPFLQIDSTLPNPVAVGFELLALGVDGARYDNLLSWAMDPGNQEVPRVATELIDFALLIVGFVTIDHYLRALREHSWEDSIAIEKIFFTLNLTPALFLANEGKALHQLFQQCPLEHFKEKVIFEVHESCQPHEVEHVITLHDTWGIRLALDDSNDMDPVAKTALEKRVVLEKSDYKETHAIFESTHGDPQKTIDTINERIRDHAELKAFVLEGIDRDIKLPFLRNHWENQRVHLLVQGRELRAGEALGKPLLPLGKQSPKLHGYGLAQEYSFEISSDDQKDTITQLPGCRLKKDYPKTKKTRSLERTQGLRVYEVENDQSMVVAQLPLETYVPSSDNRELEDSLDTLAKQIAQIKPAFLVIEEKDWRQKFLDRLRQEKICSFMPVTSDEFPQALRQFKHTHEHAFDFIQDERAHLYRSDIWVQPEVRTTTEIKEGRTFFQHWWEHENTPFALLLGDFGMGKTFLCRMFTQELIERRQHNPELPVPVYIDLRLVNFVRHQESQQLNIPSLKQLLKEVLEKQELEIDPALALKAARAGRILFIFDGLDEKVAHLTTEEADQFIWTLHSIHKAPHYTRTILACRTHYFKDQNDELRRMKGGGGGGGLSQSGISDESFSVGYLRPFDDQRIQSYLEKLVGLKKSQTVLEAMAWIYNLMDLSKRPYLLSLIAPRVEALAERTRQGQIVGAGTLYEQLVEEWIARDTGKHFVPPEEKPYIMGLLAFEFWQKGVTRLHHKKLGQWVTGPVRKFLMDIGWTDGQRDDADRSQADVRTAMFLIRDDNGNFSFAHRSFWEFFLARHLLTQMANDNINPYALVDLSPLTQEVIDFWLDLLFTTEFTAERKVVAQQIALILEAYYHPRASENAFRLMARWQQAQQGDSPSPRVVHLEKAKLAHINLSKCNLPETHWEEADLTEANLQQTTITGLIANHANLKRINAQSANWPQAQLEQAQLQEANFTNANLPHSNLKKIQGDRLNFTKANLEAANLSGASLAGSWWKQTQIPQSQLNLVNLQGATLIQCDFQSSNFTPTSLGFAALAKCHLKPIQPLSQALFQTGFGNCSFDNTSFASSNASLVLYNLPALPPTPQFGHSASVRSICFSPDNRQLASASDDQTIRLWDANSGQCLLTLHEHSASVLSVCFSPDSRQLASASLDKTIRLWDARSGKCLLILNEHSDYVLSVCFSPDGRRLASASLDKTIRLWDANSGKCLLILYGHSDYVRSVCFSPDGRRLASASLDKTIRLWDASSGECLLTLNEHSNYVLLVCFSPDGRQLASASHDKTVRLWDTSSGECLLTLNKHSDSVRSVCFSPDGRRLASASDDNTIRMWDTNSSACLHILDEHSASVLSVCFSPDGRRLTSASLDKTIRLWDANSNECLLTLDEHSASALSVCFSPDGRQLASASQDKTVRLWDTNSGECLLTLNEHSDSALSVCFSPDGRQLASASQDKTVRLWDTNSGECLLTLNNHSNYVRSICFSPDGRRFASASSDKTVRLWDARSGECLLTLKEHSASVLSVCFSPDSRQLASASSDKTVRLWDARSGQCLLTLKEHSALVLSVCFSPDGRRLASASQDKTVHLWDTNSGEYLLTLNEHLASVRSVCFSPDGRRLASASHDKTVRLWDARSGQCLLTLDEHSGSVRSVCFSPDGRRLASASDDQAIRVWEIPSGDLLQTSWLLPQGKWATIGPKKVIAYSEGAEWYLYYSQGSARIPVAAFEDD